jgi:hypothetical protein
MPDVPRPINLLHVGRTDLNSDTVRPTVDIYTGTILVNIYLRPYQEATNTLAANGGIDWLAGESLLVLGGPMAVVPTAWIVWRMINKTYR